MGFLTESTTVVDAILTDEGRRRIANGEFEISKFALFDDEIIYSKAQQTNPSSKFNTTAIFEAISENTRAGKFKLLSLDGDYTHLNTTQLVVQKGAQDGTPQATGTNAGFYVVVATQDTYNDHYQGSGAEDLPAGFFVGYSQTLVAASEDNYVKVDHGINDTTQNNFTYEVELPAELAETQFQVKMDYRLGRITTPDNVEIRPISVDDDFIASYILTATTTPDFFSVLSREESASPISGARGLRLRIPIFAAPHINSTSDSIWTDLGSEVAGFFSNGTTTAKVILATLDVEGLTTNANITVPLKFVKNA
jgi:hypothetical protein